jgi:PAT family beta-lactamase induction signal transducer AmpG
VPLPLLKRWLGQRRSWMLVAQAGIVLALVNLSGSDPSANLLHVVLGALFLAFCAATQDISVDAWRIESAAVEQQGAMAAAYQMGYSIALICGSAGALEVAHRAGWHASYATMAALGFVGIATTLIIREPKRAVAAESLAQEKRVVEWLERKAHWPASLRTMGAGFIGAVVCPLTDFMARYGLRLGVLLLLFISSYRLTEFAQGSMTNSFYIDNHYTLEQIATVVKLYGLPMRILGVLVGGALIVSLGLKRMLFTGSVLIACSNLGFALLAKILAATGVPTLWGLGLVNGFDFIAYGIHGTVLIAFLSSLTSPRYTATQYALFSTIYALPGKGLEGLSGFVVDAIGYGRFFVYTAALSIPGLLLLAWIVRRERSHALFQK